MAALVIVIILGAFLFDFCLIGFFPKLLKIWTPIGSMANEKLIEDDLVTYYIIRTDIKNSSGRPIIGNRRLYTSIVLTKKYLIIRNTRLTCLFHIGVEHIKSCDVENVLLGNLINFNLEIEGENKFLKFKTKRFEEWRSCLNELGIPLVPKL